MKKNDGSPKQATTRKVRFDIPEKSSLCENSGTENNPRLCYKDNINQKDVLEIVKIDSSKVHGTANYVNGTLNFSMNDLKREQPTDNNVSGTTIVCRNQLTNDGSTKALRKKYLLNPKKWHNPSSHRGILLNVNEGLSTNRSKIRRCTGNYFSRAREKLLTCSKTSSKSSSNGLTVPTEVRTLGKIILT